MKRILAVILFIATTVGIAYALYVFFFRAPAQPTVNAPVTNVNGAAPGGLPTAVNGAPTVGTNVNAAPPVTIPPVTGQVDQVAAGGVTAAAPLARGPVLGASVTASGEVSYYDRNDGKFYRIGTDGTVNALSGKSFRNVSAATFDPTGNVAVLEFPDGTNISYDFRTATQVTLPRHWEEFGFDGSGTQLVAKSMALDENSRFLVVANTDGSRARAVQELGPNADKVTVAVASSGHVVATSATGRKFGPDRQEIYLIGQNQEQYKSLIVEGINFHPKWNPSGSRLLYDVTGSANDWKPQLWIVDGQGDAIGANRRSINLSTWADKCAFSGDRTLYCAVPRELTTGAGLDPATAATASDDIYRVDLDTGLTSLVAVPEGGGSIRNIMVAPDGSNLYYTESDGGALNRLRLK